MDLKAWEILSENITNDGVDCLTIDEEKGGGNAIEYETGLLLYSMVRRYKPRIIFETGSHFGFSGAVLSLGLKDNQEKYPNYNGHLFSIDVNPYDQRPERLWKKIGVDDLITHVIRSSEDPETAKIICEQLNVPIDFLWLDADHSESAIWTEYNNFLPYLNPKKCLIGWHDTTLDRRMRSGIQATLSDLKEKNLWKHVFHFPLLNLRGLDFALLSNENF